VGFSLAHSRRSLSLALNQLRDVCLLVVAPFADENQIVKESNLDDVLVEVIRLVPFKRGIQHS
jgi:hypothetical protein